MTVRELIEALSSCDQDHVVVFMDDWNMVEVGNVIANFERYMQPTEKFDLVMLEGGVKN